MRHAAPSGPAVAETVAAELRATLAVALPLAGAQLAQIMMGFTSAAMMGRLGGDALAAGGLGAGLSFTVVLVFQGLLAAVGPLAAHAIGAGEDKRVGAIVGHGLLMAAVLSLAGMTIVAHIPDFLAAIGQAPSLVAATGRYLGGIVWGVPAALGYAVLRNYLSAQARTLPVMIVLVVCLALNIACNDVLIFGHFGIPALGVAGAGYANATVQWVQFAMLALFVAGGRGGGHGVFTAMRRPNRRNVAALLRLGLPIAGIFAMEAGVFSTTGIIMGLIGTAALAAHQIATGIDSIAFMVPLAFSQAASVRVARANGAGDTAAARRAGMVALGCGAGFMAAMAVFVLACPLTVIDLYLDRADPANAAVIPIALRLLVVVAFALVFDGGQAVAAGALRGLRDTAVPLLIAGIGYWVLGFGAALTLAFPLGFGAVGLWAGLAFGLTVVTLLLVARFRYLTAAPATGAAPASLVR
jgi:MATE family multidrug resistance protein